MVQTTGRLVLLCYKLLLPKRLTYDIF